MPGVTQSPPPSPSAGFNASTISSHTSRVSKHSKKYGTVVGLGHAVDGDHSNRSGASSAKAKGPHPTVMGLFEDGNGATAGGQGGPASKTDGPSASHAATAASGSKLNGPMGREDGPWSISVAEAQDKKDGSKKKQRVVSYTLYVTTPTHNLTLTRTATEIIELDQKLREGQSSANTLPALPALPVTSTQTSRRILQTISRTLSPGGNKNRVALSNLTASGLGLAPAEPISPTSSTPSTPAKPHSPASASEVSENGKINAKGNKSPHSITTHLATYLTTLSNLPFIKRHKAWKRFVRVGSDDLQSVRVERRVRKVRSDLAQHVKSSVAPTNTNVLATPSQSDIGEDSARTDDEKEDQSRSARSLSPSQASSGGAKSPSSVRDRVAGRSGIERPELPARSTSVDPERAAESDAIRKRDDLPGAVARKSRSVVSIPEEREKQTRSTPVSSNKSDGKSRESKRKDGERREKKEKSDKVTVDDFDMIRVLGKGCAGKVSWLLPAHSVLEGIAS